MVSFGQDDTPGVIRQIVVVEGGKAPRIRGGNLIRKAVFAQIEFATDSPLEGNGFELSVPVRQAKLTRSCR